MLKIILTLLAVATSIPCLAQKRERDYQDEWCKDHAGEVEVRQADRTRVDCITYYHAIEFDFDHKWAEAIGQSLHYAIMTGKRAGIVLIGDDQRYISRAMNIIARYNLPIDIWIMDK